MHHDILASRIQNKSLKIKKEAVKSRAKKQEYKNRRNVAPRIETTHSLPLVHYALNLHFPLYITAAACTCLYRKYRRSLKRASTSPVYTYLRLYTHVSFEEKKMHRIQIYFVVYGWANRDAVLPLQPIDEIPRSIQSRDSGYIMGSRCNLSRSCNRRFFWHFHRC